MAKPKTYLGVVLATRNKKLGNNSMTTYRPVGVTCPSDCRWLNNGCYAQETLVKWASQHVNPEAELFDSIMTQKTLKLKKNPSILRFHTSGDIMHYNVVDYSYVDVLNKWADIYRKMGVTIINYTHAWKRKGAELVKHFTRASANNVQETVEAYNDGWHVTVAVKEEEVEQTKIELRQAGLYGVSCLNQTRKMSCADCKLCAVMGSRERVIVMIDHSADEKKRKTRQRKAAKKA